MSLSITCPSCAHHDDIPDSFAGSPVRCPKCRFKFHAPDPEPEPEDDREEKRERRQQRRVEGDRRSTKKGVWLIAVLIAVPLTMGAVLVLSCLGGLFFQARWKADAVIADARVEAELPVLELDLKEFLSDWKANPVLVQEKHRNHRLVIAGYVRKVRSGFREVIVEICPAPDSRWPAPALEVKLMDEVIVRQMQDYPKGSIVTFEVVLKSEMSSDPQTIARRIVHKD